MSCHSAGEVQTTRHTELSTGCTIEPWHQWQHDVSSCVYCLSYYAGMMGFLGPFAIKSANINLFSSGLSYHPSVRINLEKLLKNFREILYYEILLKFVKTLQFWVKQDNSNKQFVWRPAWNSKRKSGWLVGNPHSTLVNTVTFAISFHHHAQDDIVPHICLCQARWTMAAWTCALDYKFRITSHFAIP
jgi:hypothetical protein